jgi:drug/metabolite transporter (DMT)-like permease
MVLLHIGAAESLPWTLALMRAASTALSGSVGLALWMRGHGSGAKASFSWHRAFLPAAVAGLLDTTGNLFYVLASFAGRLDVAAVLSSLYPAGTMLLAAWFLKERATRSQMAGMILALAAVALISA